MRVINLHFLAVLAFSVTAAHDVATAQTTVAADAAPIVISVQANDPGTPFPHFWEQMFGSGRAALALRDNYRRDIRLGRGVTDFHYVRFHAIFHDEVGLYDVDAKGSVVFNFSYVDQIYDGLLADGVHPFVELGFMPQKLALNPKKISDFGNNPHIWPA